MLRTVEAEALGLITGFRTLHSAALQQILVQPLGVHCRQLLQRHITKLGLDVIADESLIGLVRQPPHLHSGVVLHPSVQPLAYSVLTCF